jgi:glycosyltransferase involved in cell wall biosynthesis
MLKITVAIPTYRRPEYLKKAFASVLAQTHKPDEILLVSRADDQPTHEVIKLLISVGAGDTFIRNPQVSDAGFLPPVIRAIDAAHGDILVLLDDDAEAHSDWLARIVKYYDNPSVGGVGGRCINYFSGVLQNYPPVQRVGQLSWFGRSVGNMYCDCAFTGPTEVDFLMGGNMSYRLGLLRRCKPDTRIGKNVAFHWEMDVAQQVKSLGYRVLFDPSIKADHHSAPREIDGLRTINYEGTYWNNYNYALLMRKHLSLLGFCAYLIYTFLVGWSGSPGLAHLIYSSLRGRLVPWHGGVIASIRGRFDGIQALGASPILESIKKP